MFHYLHYSATINESKEKCFVAVQQQETLAHHYVFCNFPSIFSTDSVFPNNFVLHLTDLLLLSLSLYALKLVASCSE